MSSTARFALPREKEHGSLVSDARNEKACSCKTALLLGVFNRMKASIMQENPPPVLDASDLRTFIRTFVHLPLMGLKTNNFALFRIVVSEMMVNEELRTLYYQQILEPTLALAETYLLEQAPKLGS
jgi:hypothetical protein